MKNNITVVLPIYRDTAMTLDCIHSALPGILAIKDTKFVLVNDASPDTDMQSALEEIAAKYPETIVLLINEVNLGFVATVNRGMKLTPENDILLLNSDVILPDDTWLHRLAEDAYEANDIASVTPLSNNTTICTFPNFLQDNPIPFDLTVTAVDKAFKGKRYPCVEAPTGVGFCMFIRRNALDAIGYFDEKAFGRGYGEENDFCQRAIQKGYRNLISPNLYAYHLGGVSFGEEKQALIENACKVIDNRYPSYHSDVQVFIGKDPLREARIYRLAQLIAQTELPKILFISHGTGGGVEQHIDELAEALNDQAIFLRLVPEGDNGMVKLSLSTSQTSDSLFFDFEKDYQELLNLLKQLGISLLHYHHTVRFGEQIFTLPNDLGIPHIFTLHDFYLLGGNPTLSDETGIYPGHFDETLENPMYPYPKGVTREQFRSQHKHLLTSAKMVLFPSYSTQAIFGDIYQLPNPHVIPHLELKRDSGSTVSLQRKNSYTIGIFGAISREKGADLIEAMATYAKKNNFPIKFVIIGYAYRSLKDVNVTGPFVHDDLPLLIEENAIDVAFFSARWAETYSYTLSYAIHNNLPIVAPRLGAFIERLKDRPITTLFNHLDSAQDITEQLYKFIDDNAGKTTTKWSAPNTDLAKQFYCHDYLQLVKKQPTISDFLPEQVIDVKKSPSKQLNNKEKLVVRLWNIYTHPSMRWINHIVPFRVRRGLKRLLSRQAIHDLVKKHENN